MPRLLVWLVLLAVCTTANAGRFLKPPAEVVKIASMLAYSDFPTKTDILIICRLESGYIPKAFNSEFDPKRPHRKVQPSNGIMQVQGGPSGLQENMAVGIAMLRTNYMILGSREAAVKAYNVGVYGYQRGWAKKNVAEYWAKFVKYEVEVKQVLVEMNTPIKPYRSAKKYDKRRESSAASRRGDYAYGLVARGERNSPPGYAACYRPAAGGWVRYNYSHGWLLNPVLATSSRKQVGVNGYPYFGLTSAWRERQVKCSFIADS